ncbi:MAG: beta-propeller fold lactonase family protein, partial [Acidobacteriaceae bacterium]
MKFWKYGRVVLALIGAIVLGLSITCCGVYTSGYMYVTGAQYNQIGAFKIDHDFGYLTPVTGQPFASAGNNPVQAVVIPGGRFLATVNKGSGDVSIYTIGGAGTLYYQASYATSGSNPVSIGMNPTGNFLYVVDQNAPPDIVNGVDLNAGRGDITVFQIDPSTGRLTLITNQNTFNTNGSQLPYFMVNYKPVQIISSGGGSGAYVYVLDQAYAAGSIDPSVPAACMNAPAGSPCTTPDVFLYAISSSNGQLTLTQNTALTLPTLPGAASTIYTSGKYV